MPCRSEAAMTSESIQRRRQRAMRLIAVAGVVAGWSSYSHAVTRTWDDGGGDAHWSTANNWNPNGVPGSGDPLLFPTSIPNLISTITLASGETALSLTFNNNYTLSSGDLTLGAG